MKSIATEKFAEFLRTKGLECDTQKIRITRFDNTDQSKDLTLPPNCMGFGRIHHFKRFIAADWPPNPLPQDPACFALGIPFTDRIKVQLYQNAVCSWRCWYCFVDDKLLRGDLNYSELKSAEEILDLYCMENERMPVIDISGGQPELIPEWSYWMLKAIHKRNLNQDIYLWSDDSLSNDYLWRYLSTEEIQFMAKCKNYGRVGCFKGFDEYSFSFNTRANPCLFQNQFSLMNRLVKEGFDVYGYLTLTTDNEDSLVAKVNTFLDRTQELIHPLFPLRIVPLKIFKFSPTSMRTKGQHDRAISVQQLVVEVWREEIRRRFDEQQLNAPIYSHCIH